LKFALTSAQLAADERRGMKYLITGGSGYIGSRLVELLGQREDTERVVIADLRPPAVPWPKSAYVEMDVRDPAMAKLVELEQPDALVHLAFVLNPLRDERLMYDIDVNGTHNVLEAASRAGTEHVLVASSTTAYGAWPDNPVPLPEEHPVRGMPNYEYARDKTEMDRMCQLWAARHPDRAMTIVRPCIVFGPNVDNYIIRIWLTAPFMLLVDGIDAEIQYVHENDVVDALSRLLIERKAGIFNLTGDGTLKTSEAAQIAGLKTRSVGYRGYRRLASAFWRLRVPRVEAPPGQIDFFRYPWIAANDKIKAELDWQPRYTSRETFEIALRAKGKAAAPEVDAVRSPVAVAG
jgi:UDP-glucose 4-epimerase